MMECDKTNGIVDQFRYVTCHRVLLKGRGQEQQQIPGVIFQWERRRENKKRARRGELDRSPISFGRCKNADERRERERKTGTNRNKASTRWRISWNGDEKWFCAAIDGGWTLAPSSNWENAMRWASERRRASGAVDGPARRKRKKRQKNKSDYQQGKERNVGAYIYCRAALRIIGFA